MDQLNQKNLKIDLEDLEEKQFKTKWIAGLSNGEMAVEGKDKFAVEPGKPSPWQKLIRYCAENKLQIKSLQVRYKNRSFNLPSMASRPKFPGLTPIEFRCERKIEGDISSAGVVDKRSISRYICIEAIFSEFKLQLWVDENGDGNSWNSIVPNK